MVAGARHMCDHLPHQVYILQFFTPFSVKSGTAKAASLIANRKRGLQKLVHTDRIQYICVQWIHPVIGVAQRPVHSPCGLHRAPDAYSPRRCGLCGNPMHRCTGTFHTWYMVSRSFPPARSLRCPSCARHVSPAAHHTPALAATSPAWSSRCITPTTWLLMQTVVSAVSGTGITDLLGELSPDHFERYLEYQRAQAEEERKWKKISKELKRMKRDK